MIVGRNQAQQEANEQNQNQKRNASAAGRAIDNCTVSAATIRSVQFDDEGTNEGGNASSLFGSTGRKKRHIGVVVSF
jgi:hypothetical protein